MNFPFFRRRRRRGAPGGPAAPDQPPAADPAHRRDRRQFQEVLTASRASRVADRLQVLDAFLASDHHITLNELANRVAEQDPALMDRNFLDETMELFCRFGFAQRRSFENRETVYEHRHLGDHHDHLICTRCGAIEEFTSPAMERLQLEIAREKGFHPLQHRMEIYGLCGRCLDQRAGTIPLVMAAKGELLRIVAVEGDDAVRHRLEAMGLQPGVCLEVINIAPAGPVVVAVGESRLALDAESAARLMVTHDCRIAGD